MFRTLMIGAVSALTLSAAAFARRRFGLIIAGAALASIFAGLPISTVEAQSGIVGHGQKPGKLIPFKAQRERPQLTPEQMRLQEERLRHHKDTHGDPTSPEAPAAEAPAPQAPPAADETNVLGITPDGTFKIFQSTVQAYLAGIISQQAETQAATSATNVVFYTGNVFASFSTDGGASFTFVNPFTQFPTLDGGLCCDQTVIYDPTRDLMIWQLQYDFSSTTGKGSYRTAFANPGSVASGGWCVYEWNPGDFGFPSGRSLDRPEVALSSNFVWYSANIYTEPDAKFERSVMWRIRLDPPVTCDSRAFEFFLGVPAQFHFTPVQGATDTMYWANLQTFPTADSIRIYQWAEADSTPSSTDVAISLWPNARPRLCPGPDVLNWCRAADKRQASGWIANGVIGFMWSASQGTGALGDFPFPYVHVARFNASTTPTLIDEPIIWNSGGAWIYPNVGVNDRGAIAGTLYFGGGVYFPYLTALILDDLTTAAPPPWEIYGFVASTGAGDDRWGDYYSSRRNGSNGNTWVISGQAVNAGVREAWYVWMGRSRDAPLTEMTSPGVQGTSPTSASSDYLRFWWEDISRQRPPARSP